MSDAAQLYEQVCGHARETALLVAAESVLGWDERTLLPIRGAEFRAEQVTLLAGMIHQRRTDPRLGEWLGELAASPLAADPHSDSGATIRHLKREFDKRIKLPQSLVEELTRTASLAQHVWQAAARQRRFRLVSRPIWQRCSSQAAQAEAVGYEESPYDALLDDYEPGRPGTATSPGCWPICAARWCRWWRRSPTSGRSARRVDPVAALSGRDAGVVWQRGGGEDRFRLSPRAIGRDGPSVLHERSGRTIAASPPASTSIIFRRRCSAFCTRPGTASTTRDCGPSGYGLPPGEAISLGIHESQSRLWENLVGRSRAVLAAFLSARRSRRFRGAWPTSSLDDFYFAINDVRPSLIRVEADEATYNSAHPDPLRVGAGTAGGRFAGGRFAGGLERKVSRISRHRAGNDAEGVLQDIHWARG